VKQLPKSRQKLLALLVAALIVVAGLVSYYYATHATKYDNPDFKTYVNARKACSNFMGGDNDVTIEEMYKDWQNHTPIAC
jgi:hypothetical protein